MRALAALILIGFWPAAAASQDRTGAAQIPAVAATAVPPAQPAEATSEAPPQISGGQDSAPDQAQLTAPATSSEQPAQVAKRSRDPQSSEPLSTPEQGRTAAVERVSGHDKCDPAEGSEKRTLECRKIIENRAAEYRRPPPTQLSPEQKLMIDQQLRAEADATQRLSQSGDPQNHLDSMAIASVVLSQRDEADEAKKKEQDQQNQAAVQALITVLQSTPPPQ